MGTDIELERFKLFAKTLLLDRTNQLPNDFLDQLSTSLDLVYEKSPEVNEIHRLVDTRFEENKRTDAVIISTTVAGPPIEPQIVITPNTSTVGGDQKIKVITTAYSSEDGHTSSTDKLQSLLLQQKVR